MRISRVVVGALVLCVSLSSAALGSEIEAGPRSEPKTEGPVQLQSSQCSNHTVKSDEGAVLGRAEACVYVYRFDTLSELDALREYGAAWLQARFVPSNGWCATAVSTRLEVAGGRAEGETRVPKTGGKVGTKLVLDAGGHALQNASISQKWTAAPGESGAKAVDGRPGVITSWSGETGKAVNLVSGAGYSFEMLGSAPESINFGFNKFSLASC